MEAGSCLIGERVATIKAGTNPHAVAETETGYVVVGDHQFLRGYTLLLAKRHDTELHELDEKMRLQFLADMADVAAAVFRAFKPRKLNYELLGNLEPHLHWHLIPRHADDPRPQGPASVIDPAVRNAESTKPSQAQLEDLKAKLAAELPSAMHRLVR